MAQQSPDYKALFLEAQRERDEAQRERDEAQRRQEDTEREAQRERDEAQRRQEDTEREAQREREEAQRRQEETQRKADELQAAIRPTNLPEFLHGCHEHFQRALAVQTDQILSTQGDPMNARNKLRPDKVRIWSSFADDQAAIWADLMASALPEQRHFYSLNALAQIGKVLRPRLLASELDLTYFLRLTIEDPVTAIIQRMYENSQLRDKFHLQGSVSFENHANTLSLEDDLKELRIDETGLEQLADSSGLAETAAKAKSLLYPPRADQFCVYNVGRGPSARGLPVIIFESKAPHKLPLGYVYEGLNGLDKIDLDEVVRVPLDETPPQKFQRLMAAIITQAFSYMVQAGVEYGCVSTGECFIFLRVPDNPKTVEYFLSVPIGDVSAGGGATMADDNGLHLTAVGQMLAFTLRALRTTPRSQKWRDSAYSALNTWTVEYEEILEQIVIKEPLTSDWQPPTDERMLRMSPVRISPIRLRPLARRVAAGCATVAEHTSDDEFHPDPDTPSRPPPSSSRRGAAPSARGKGKSAKQTAAGAADRGRRRSSEADWEYCTQDCLLGLQDGYGALDLTCPNAQLHGTDRHMITCDEFMRDLRSQMLRDPDEGCWEIGRPGSRGVMFKITLQSHGYTVVAKGTPAWFVRHLRHEASIYDILRPIQGSHIPVHLGSMDLDRPWYYQGIVLIVHMMVLGYAGQPIFRIPVDREVVRCEVEKSVRAVHQHGVLQGDAEARNLLWSDGRIMVIDFERAKVLEQRTVLAELSPNRKRKYAAEGAKSANPPACETPACVGELNRALAAVPVAIGPRR